MSINQASEEHSGESITMEEANIGPALHSNCASFSDDKTTIGFGSRSRFRNKPTRRSLSGTPLTCLFETKFQHFKAFQKKQSETKGLNFLLAPQTSSGPFYRSSLPVTPISTPLFNQNLKFTEQSLHNRILSQSQSPRRNRFRSTLDEPADFIAEVSESQLNLSQATSSTSANDKILKDNTVTSDANSTLPRDNKSSETTLDQKKSTTTNKFASSTSNNSKKETTTNKKHDNRNQPKLTHKQRKKNPKG